MLRLIVLALAVALTFAGIKAFYSSSQVDTLSVSEPSTLNNAMSKDSNSLAQVETTRSNNAVSLENSTNSSSITISSSEDKPSPFDLLPEQSNQGGNQNPSSTLPANTPPSKTTLLTQPLSVPSSYPVSEASQYFVPKAERQSGNLGGPPPLDLPGGPLDPNGPFPFSAPDAPAQ